MTAVTKGWAVGDWRAAQLKANMQRLMPSYSKELEGGRGGRSLGSLAQTIALWKCVGCGSRLSKEGIEYRISGR
jgi:hypothetical protein